MTAVQEVTVKSVRWRGPEEGGDESISGLLMVPRILASFQLPGQARDTEGVIQRGRNAWLEWPSETVAGASVSSSFFENFVASAHFDKVSDKVPKVTEFRAGSMQLKKHPLAK